MPPHADAIADCVLAAFKQLPAKCKPRVLSNGSREWVPLAGIVLSRDKPLTPVTSNRESFRAVDGSTEASYPKHDLRSHPSTRPHEAEPDGVTETATSISLECVAVATGMKCLPRSGLAHARGNVLHDWHAEVLVLRGFNRWLLDQCTNLSENEPSRSGNAWLRILQPRPEQSLRGSDPKDILRPRFALQKDVQVHMYCSETPCGDASMELTMAEQDDPTPWARSDSQSLQNSSTHTSVSAESIHSPRASPLSHDEGDTPMLGRGHFDRLGIVRRKPSRPDAPSSWSKSCTDKLALRQCTGITSSLVNLFFPTPIYLSTLVLPAERCVHGAVERAWGVSGRMQPMISSNRTNDAAVHCQRDFAPPSSSSSSSSALSPSTSSSPYSFTPFRVLKTSRQFEFDKSPSAKASNLSVLALPHRTEVLINGVLQGRKRDDPRGASSASRRRMWEAANDISKNHGGMGLTAPTYAQVKMSALLKRRREMKKMVYDTSLKPWIRNTGDDGWNLD